MSTATGVRGNRTAWTVVIACLVIAGASATAVAAAPVHVTVSSATVSDDEPTTGDTITVTPTIRHSSSGSGSFEVTQVTLEDASGTRYAAVDDLGTLGAGDSIDVSLRATLESAGERTLVVRVRGVQYDAEGRWNRVVTTAYPTYVTVSEPTSSETKPQLNVEAEDLTAGAESTVSVMVSNGRDDDLSNLSVELSGLGGTENRTKLRPSLGAHNSTTFEFDVRPRESGSHRLNATLRYDDGSVVETSEPVDVSSLQSDASVYATVTEENDSAVLQYRVTNRGNTPLENVVVSGAAVGTPLPTTVIDRVAPGASETATVQLNGRPSGPATVSAAYEVGSTTGGTEQTVEFAAPASPTANTTATPAETPGTGERQDRENWFGPVSFLTGGVIATGSIIGYRNWGNGS